MTAPGYGSVREHADMTNCQGSATVETWKKTSHQHVLLPRENPTSAVDRP